MPDVLSIEVSEEAGRCLVTATGEIDLATAPLLEERLGALDARGPLILDLSRVGFIDSTGLRVVLGADEAATARGHDLAIVAVDGPVTRLFEITGVRERLTIFDSVEAAAGNG